MSSPPPLPWVKTGDGSLTFFSEEFGQTFHNTSGARQEALEKFVLPCHLDRLPLAEIHLLDVCFGLGYNSGLALQTIWQANPTCRIELIGLERSPAVPRQALAQGIWAEWDPALAELLQQGQIESERLRAALLWGDARQTISAVPLAWADAVFLDPFSPSACPELWTVEFLRQVALRMAPTGRLATYSCAAAARAALLAAGLQIGSTPPLGRPWPGTVASPAPDDLPPLSQAEHEHLHTRAAVPYRDPTLSASRDQIRRTRQAEQQRSPLEPTSAWKARWV